MKLLFGLLALLTLSGCQYDPHARTYTTEKPSVGDIEGEYELSQIYMESYAAGIREKIQALPSPPTVHIYSDGRLTASNFPYFSETRQGFEYRFEDFRPLDTTWKQAVVGGISDGSGHIKDHQGIRLSGLPVYLSSPGFTGTKKVEGLIFGFGDPDSGDAIIFKKK
ncbi:MAG: hypothetical protein BWX84_03191 [Verrucomicrobia bacterium ADurb.Bin118]|nr:MAG: hypothetical protein BWX84_03191 [Verrucomicrobia bacterium ADurb.Bin118]